MPAEMNGVAGYASPRSVITMILAHRDGRLGSPVTAGSLVKAGVPDSQTKRLLNSARTLDFIDDAGNFTPDFDSLRKISTAEFKPRLAQMMRATYQPVLAQVNPSGASLEEVQDAFRSFQPALQRVRMVSLFLGLLAYTEEWPDLPAMRSGQGASTMPRPRAVSARGKVTVPPPTPAPAAATQREQYQLVVALRTGGTMTLGVSVNPLTLRGEDREFFYDVVDKLNDYQAEVGITSVADPTALAAGQ